MSKPTIITISGKAQHGKTTFAKYLNLKLAEDYRVKIIPFAKGVKEEGKKFGWDGKKDNNGRVLLQLIGDFYRQIYGDEIWIRKAEEQFNDEDFIIIDDCRYINEATYFKNHRYNQTNVRIERFDMDGTVFDNRLSKEAKNHISETELDNFNFNCLINNFILEHLKRVAELFARELRINEYE